MSCISWLELGDGGELSVRGESPSYWYQVWTAYYIAFQALIPTSTTSLPPLHLPPLHLASFCFARLLSQDVRTNSTFLSKNAIQPGYDGYKGYFYTPSSSATLDGPGLGLQIFDSSKLGNSLVVNNTVKAATHVITLSEGEVVEVVLQGMRAGAAGGEYNSSSNVTSNRNGREQHPFHLHGHHFWVVGTGPGQWNKSAVSGYNLKNPVVRDTSTIFSDPGTANFTGWMALR
jgi:hypothetical protein